MPRRLLIDPSQRLRVDHALLLAHPARWHVFEYMLRTRKTLTTTAAAQVAHVSPSTMSYHLHVLMRAGLVRARSVPLDGRKTEWTLRYRSIRGLTDWPTGTAEHVASGLARDVESDLRAMADGRYYRPGDPHPGICTFTVECEPLLAALLTERIGDLLELMLENSPETWALPGGHDPDDVLYARERGAGHFRGGRFERPAAVAESPLARRYRFSLVVAPVDTGRGNGGRTA